MALNLIDFLELKVWQDGHINTWRFHESVPMQMFLRYLGPNLRTNNHEIIITYNQMDQPSTPEERERVYPWPYIEPFDDQEDFIEGVIIHMPTTIDYDITSEMKILVGEPKG